MAAPHWATAQEVRLTQSSDKARVRPARLLVMKRLEEYGMSAEEVASILNIKITSVRRWIRSPVIRLPRHTAPSHGPLHFLLPDPPTPIVPYQHPRPPDLAYKLAMVTLVRAGYEVAVIMKVLDVSRATVYRARSHVEAMHANPPAWLDRWLYEAFNYRDDDPKPPIALRSDRRRINVSAHMSDD